MLQDQTGALAETVLWLRQFKKRERKLSRFLCVYPRYLGIKLYSQDHVTSNWISRQWRENCIAAGYYDEGSEGKKIAQYQFRDIPIPV